MNVSQIELSLTPALYDWRTIKERHTTVAVDILRATTAICAAFFAGAKEIVPLDSLEPLEAYHAQGYLRAAERGGKKIGDAEYGNSPTEYLSSNLHGKRMAYSTTNGTVSILRGSDAERTLVGCFANINTLTHLLIDKPRTWSSFAVAGKTTSLLKTPSLPEPFVADSSTAANTTAKTMP